MDSGLPASLGPGMTSLLLRTMLDQPVEKSSAFLELRNRDELVGLVRLIDVSRSAYHGGDAGLRKQTALGAVRDLAVAVASGEPLREQCHLGIRRGIEPGELRAVLEFEPRLGRDLLYLGLEHVLRVVDHFLGKVG